MIIKSGSENKTLNNNILAIEAEAIKAKKEDSSVINSTTGMLKNEDGSLYVFDSVKKVIEHLSNNEKYAYTNSLGTPEYKEAVLYSLFGKNLPEIRKTCYLESIVTPGGSGGLNLALSNYMDEGDTLLLPNYMWENYLTYGIEMGFESDTYHLFNEKGLFDIDYLIKKIDILKKKQNRITILINDPCENPTGFCMRDEDYDALINISRKNPNNSFVYLMDVAYFDFYNVDQDIIRKRFSKFKDIPSNAIALFVFSGSKSFGLYGLRVGALVALTHDEDEIKVFLSASNFSTRAKWSDSSTLGMSIIEKLVLNDKFRESYENEIKSVCKMLEDRCVIFLNKAKEVGLKTLPYEKGFFICIPCDNPKKIAEALHQDKVYIIPTSTCLRIALCTINIHEASILPKLIKDRLDKVS